MSAPDGRRERSVWTSVPAIGVSVHAREWDGPAAAAGPPVVFVAGLGVSSRYWVRLGRRLSGRLRVLAPDLPGFGRTRRPPAVAWPGGPDPREQADQLLAWMDARSLRRALLVGHSVGCQTAADLAARCPDRVERLVLMAPPFEPGRRSFAACVPRLALGALFEVPSLAPLLAVEYGSAGLPRAIQQASRAMRHPFLAGLSPVAAPALVVHGRFDPLVGRAWVEQVVASLSHAGWVEVDGVGHAMHYSAAAVTAAAIDDFLDGRYDAGAGEPRDGAVVVPRDDPRRDPLGPPQPWSVDRWCRAVYQAALVTAFLSRAIACGPRARRTMVAAAAISAAVAATTDRPSAAVRRVPVVTGATIGAGCGVVLIAAALTCRSREPTAGRWAAALYGLYLVAAAAVTAKPTGPARYRGRAPFRDSRNRRLGSA